METTVTATTIKNDSWNKRDSCCFFSVFQSLRVKYYKQGDRVSETELAKGLQLLRWYRKKANLHNNWRTFRYNLLFCDERIEISKAEPFCLNFCLFFYLRLEMLEYSDERRPWESMEEKLTLIRFVIHFSCIHFIFSLQQFGEFHSYSQEKDANDFLNFVRFGLKFEPLPNGLSRIFTEKI